MNACSGYAAHCALMRMTGYNFVKLKTKLDSVGLNDQQYPFQPTVNDEKSEPSSYDLFQDDYYSPFDDYYRHIFFLKKPCFCRQFSLFCLNPDYDICVDFISVMDL